MLVDDFVGSGQQAVDILETWFGVPRTVDLGEDRGGPLPKYIQESLKKKKLAFVFIAGWSDGVKLLEKKAKEFGLDASVHLGMTEDKVSTAFDPAIYKNPDIQSDFLALCAQIGFELMKSPGNDPERACERCWGYGNRANLLIFTYNTPAQTLTCMWATGKYGGASWTSLFPRRKKV
ncbi:hypothetical protein ACFLYR_03395 [Chloroflexota bacterium]